MDSGTGKSERSKGARRNIAKEAEGSRLTALNLTALLAGMAP